MMDLLSVLQLLSWLVIGVVMFLLAATAGFDLGAGILLPFLGRKEDERRVVINTVGPTWDGNQVWLIVFGGALFAIWPRVYAASFSGFYFAVLLILWSLFLRPVSFEYRSKLQSARWRGFWDWALFVGSLLPTLLCGMAIGNVMMGVPFNYDPITLRFFYEGSFWGLLRGFPFVCGFLSIFLLTMHASTYILLRTEGIVYERARSALLISGSLFIIFFIVAGLYAGLAIEGYQLVASDVDLMKHPLTNTVVVGRGYWMLNYVRYPWSIAAPILGFAGAVLAIFLGRADHTRSAFYCSVLSVLGVVLSFGFALFPFVMPSSSHPAQSLLVWNASSSALSLLGILICAVIMLPIIFIYTGFVYYKLWNRGRRLSTRLISEEDHSLY